MSELRTKEEIEKRLAEVELNLDACAPEYGETEHPLMAILSWRRLELQWMLGMESSMREYQPKPLPREYFQ